MIAKSVEELRAWQLTYAFKLGVYDLLRSSEISTDKRLEDQITRSAASAVSQIEEGFGRFYPKEFARMVVNGKASLFECRGHLRDAVDRRLLSDSVRREHDQRAADALKEIAGLIDYLQSDEAEENAKRIKAQRAERWRQRHRKKRSEDNERNEVNTGGSLEPGTKDARTQKPQRRTENTEPRTERTRADNTEPGTRTENED